MTDQLLQRLPHRGPAALLDRVLEVGPTRARASCHLFDGHPYHSSSGVHSLLTIELFAQAAALVLVQSAGPDPGASGGLLAAVPELQLKREFLPLDRTLIVFAEAQGSFGKLKKFAGRLATEDGEELARGEILVHENALPR